jgi:hypothetical protein
MIRCIDLRSFEHCDTTGAVCDDLKGICTQLDYAQHCTETYINVCCVRLRYKHVYLDCALVAADICSVISDGLRLLPLLLLELPIVSREGGVMFNSSSTPAAFSQIPFTISLILQVDIRILTRCC